MRKWHVLILSILFIILSMSYVSAADNSTDTFKEQNNDAISIDEQDSDNISISEEDNIAASENNENISTIITLNDDAILKSNNNTEVLAVSLPENVLSSEASVTPLSSSDYKTPTKKQRTFNIGGFKAVLSEYQYKKLYKISSVEDYFFDNGYDDYYYVGDEFKGYHVGSTGFWYTVKVKTNKYIKVKVKIRNKYYIKKTRAYMFFSYGAGQSGVAYRHMVFLTHNYANPGYDYAKVLGSSAKYFSKCKQSASFTKLNKSKLYRPNYVYKKYSVY